MKSVDVKVKNQWKIKCIKKVVWNPSVCACECNRKCKIDEYLHRCTCVISVFDDSVITYEDKTKITLRNSFHFTLILFH